MSRYKDLTLPALKRLSRKIAKRVAKKGAVIGLIGNLGAGKTTFAKEFALSLGIKSVKSPTFIVSQRYEFGSQYLFHLDFYRLNHKKQLEPLGLAETISRPNIVLIEWVDKFPQIMRKCDILINLKFKPGNKRDVEVKFK